MNGVHKFADPISRIALKDQRYVCVHCGNIRTIQGLQQRVAAAGGLFYSCKSPCYCAIFHLEGEEEVFYLTKKKGGAR